jgi:predicted nucleic acid-binding protein
MIFVDTSVIVAASQPYDPRHPACLNRLAIADARGGACAAHTLSEIFAVLTRLPPPYRLPADAALQIVKHTSKRLTVIALTPAEHIAAIERFVARGRTQIKRYPHLYPQFQTLQTGRPRSLYPNSRAMNRCQASNFLPCPMVLSHRDACPVSIFKVNLHPRNS